MKLTMTPQDRVEYDALVREVLTHRTASERTEAMRAGLVDAVAARRGWATAVLEDVQLDGIRRLVRSEARTEKAAFKTKKGATVDVSTTAGVKDGDEWVQIPFASMTRDQVSSHLDLIEAQLRKLGVRKSALRDLLAVLVRHPECETVGAALSAEGTTLDEVLAA